MTQPSLPIPRRGEVVQVYPPEGRETGVVVVKDEHGEIHNFVTGSLNSVLPKYREVGVVGVLKYIRSSSSALWYFQPD